MLAKHNFPLSGISQVLTTCACFFIKYIFVLYLVFADSSVLKNDDFLSLRRYTVI